MIKNKIIALMTCGALISAGIAGGALISNKSSNTNEKTIQNHILLSAPDLNDLAVVINTNVNPLVLYSSPNSNSNIESYISVGEMLNYTATSNPNFYKVTVQETGATGYLSASNMQIIQSGLNKAYENVNKNGQVINVTYDVKLMSSPSVHSQILGSYKNTSPMIILGKQDQWYKVEIGNQTGYMYQSYVGIDNTTANASTNATNTNDVTTQSSNTNIPNKSGNSSNLIGQTVYTNPILTTFVQTQPNGSSSNIAVIKNQTTPLKILNVLSENNGASDGIATWYKVQMTNGQEGYIQQTETYQKIITTGTKDNTPVFALATSSSKIIMSTKYKPTKFYVIDKVKNNTGAMDISNGYLYQVRTNNGMLGYISTSLN